MSRDKQLRRLDAVELKMNADSEVLTLDDGSTVRVDRFAILDIVFAAAGIGEWPAPDVVDAFARSQPRREEGTIDGPVRAGCRQRLAEHPA